MSLRNVTRPTDSRHKTWIKISTTLAIRASQPLLKIATGLRDTTMGLAFRTSYFEVPHYRIGVARSISRRPKFKACAHWYIVVTSLHVFVTCEICLAQDMADTVSVNFFKSQSKHSSQALRDDLVFFDLFVIALVWRLWKVGKDPAESTSLGHRERRPLLCVIA